MTIEPLSEEIHPARETFILHRALVSGRIPWENDAVTARVLVAAGWPDQAAVAARYTTLTGSPPPTRIHVPALTVATPAKLKPAPRDRPAPSTHPRQTHMEAWHTHNALCTGWPAHGGTLPADVIAEADAPPEQLATSAAARDAAADQALYQLLLARLGDVEAQPIDEQPPTDVPDAVQALVDRVQQYRPAPDPQPAWDGLCDICSVRVDPAWAANTGHRRHLNHLNAPPEGAS